MEGYRDDAAGHELAYTIRWKSGLGEATDAQHYDLKLDVVSGTIYRQKRPVASFSADRGAATKATGLLTLTGNVLVRAVDSNLKPTVRGSRIACETLNYKTSDQILKAAGQVTVFGPSFELGPFDEVWSTNDLSEVAAPGEFTPVRHNQRSMSRP